MTDATDQAYLPCALCGTDAIPASGSDDGEPTWCEDDEADCPGCGTRLRGFITGDETGEWITAMEIEPDTACSGSNLDG